MNIKNFIKELRENNKLYKEKNKEIAIKITDKMKTSLIQTTKQFTPVQTGYLKSNFKSTSTSARNNKVIAKVYNNVRYAYFVEYGDGGKDGKVFQTEREIQHSNLARLRHALRTGQPFIENDLRDIRKMGRLMLNSATNIILYNLKSKKYDGVFRNI